MPLEGERPVCVARGATSPDLPTLPNSTTAATCFSCHAEIDREHRMHGAFDGGGGDGVDAIPVDGQAVYGCYPVHSSIRRPVSCSVQSSVRTFKCRASCGGFIVWRQGNLRHRSWPWSDADRAGRRC